MCALPNGRCADLWDDKAQHNQRLTAVLKRLQATGVTLNSEKCEFLKIRMKFLGHVIDPEGTEGIRTDPEKISAIVKMTVPPLVTSFPWDG